MWISFFEAPSVSSNKSLAALARFPRFLRTPEKRISDFWKIKKLNKEWTENSESEIQIFIFTENYCSSFSISLIIALRMRSSLSFLYFSLIFWASSPCLSGKRSFKIGICRLPKTIPKPIIVLKWFQKCLKYILKSKVSIRKYLFFNKFS